MSIHNTGQPPGGQTPNKDVVATIVERDCGGSVPRRPEFWLTPPQADYFLGTGEDLEKVARLSEAIAVGRLAGGPVFVPLSSDAGPEELTAAREAAKEQVRVSRENPLAATKWRDHLLRTGQAVVQARRTPRAPYEIIAPVELCDLTVAGLNLVNRRGEIAFYDVRISGWDLWEVRQAAVAAMAPAEIKPVAAAELPTSGKFADSTPTGGEARTAPANAVFAGGASAEKFSQRRPRDGNNNTVNDTSEELRPASDPQIDAAASAPPEKEPLKPAERQGGSEASPDSQAAAGSIVERLAEWIFAKRPRHHFNTLCDEALEDADLVARVGGTFLKGNFREAYRRVYRTKRGHPPAAGWSLLEPYKSRTKEASKS